MRSDNIQDYTYLRLVYRILNIGSVLVAPVFTYFAYVAARTGTDEFLDKIDANNSQANEVISIALCVTVSLMRYICEITAVNPIESTEDSLNSNDNIRYLAHLRSATSRREKNVIRLFTLFNQSIAYLSFIIGATADAVAVAYQTALQGLRWALGIPLTLFGFSYYVMLTNTKLKDHTFEFIHRLYSAESMFINALRFPVKSFEVIIQVFSNAANRGVLFGYIMNQLYTEFLKGDNNVVNLILVGSAAFTTFYTALFSRVLNVHKKYFNPKYDTISSDIINSVKIQPLGIFIDTSMTLLRAVSAAVLLTRHGSDNYVLNFSLAIVTGLFLFTHGFYIRYQNRRQEMALGSMDRSDLEVHPSERASIQVDSMSPQELFDHVKERFKSPRLKSVVTVINTGGRISNWLGFFGSLVTLNKLLKTNSNLDMDFYDLLCIQQLWGLTTLENLASFYQDTMIDNIAYYRTKGYLEHNPSCLSGCASFFRARKDYQREYLSQCVLTRATSLAMDSQPTAEDVEETPSGVFTR